VVDLKNLLKLAGSNRIREMRGSYRKSKAQGSIPPSSRSSDPSRALSQREQQRELERANQIYTCSFDKDTEKIRYAALSKRENVCQYVKRVVREQVTRERGEK
jgi:hypothetical protein